MKIALEITKRTLAASERYHGELHSLRGHEEYISNYRDFGPSFKSAQMSEETVLEHAEHFASVHF